MVGYIFRTQSKL